MLYKLMHWCIIKYILWPALFSNRSLSGFLLTLPFFKPLELISLFGFQYGDLLLLCLHLACFQGLCCLLFLLPFSILLLHEFLDLNFRLANWLSLLLQLSMRWHTWTSIAFFYQLSLKFFNVIHSDTGTTCTFDTSTFLAPFGTFFVCFLL